MAKAWRQNSLGKLRNSDRKWRPQSITEIFNSDSKQMILLTQLRLITSRTAESEQVKIKTIKLTIQTFDILGKCTQLQNLGRICIHVGVSYQQRRTCFSSTYTKIGTTQRMNMALVQGWHSDNYRNKSKIFSDFIYNVKSSAVDALVLTKFMIQMLLQ